MILTDILFRTFFIKGSQYGTAFTIDVGDTEYLVTAKHLIDTTKPAPEIQVFRDKKWQRLQATVVGVGKGEIDVAVLRTAERLTSKEFKVIPSMGEITLGHDVYFLGFPYKMWSDIGSFMGGLPCPFAKKGMLSSLSAEKPQVLYVDAINNEGFSGGPLFFYPNGKPKELRIAGIVSKFRIEEETVLTKDGEQTDMKVPYNTGFLVAYSINHAVELIGPRSA